MTPNLRAFLLVIRACEGTLGHNGYRTLYGGGLFDGFDDHPNRVVTASGYSSTAAGAYMILYRTWRDFIAANGPHDFSASSQDLCARWLIGRRGATADVEAGRLDDAIAKCNREWASLPGSPYGQPTRDLAYCRRKFAEFGGVEMQAPGGIAAQPDDSPPEQTGAPAPIIPPESPAPQPNPPAAPGRGPMDPLSLVSILAGVFAPVIRAKAEKALGSDVGGPLADNLLAIAKKETGKADPLEAVAVARQSPAIVAKLESAASDWLSQVAPLMDKIDAFERGAWAAEEGSRDAAAKRGAAMQEAGILGNPQFVIASFILAMVAGVVFTVLYRDTFSTDMQSFVIGAIVGGALTAVISFFFGTSRSSAAKDVVIGELAARR